MHEMTSIEAVHVLRKALTKARDTFLYYGNLHAAKPDLEKASRNFDLAKEMQAALDATE